MSSRGDESPPSTSGRGYDDTIDLSYDSWGESEATSGGVIVASSSYNPVTVSSHKGTSRVMEDIPMGIPMGLSRLLRLLLINPANVLKEEDVMRIKYSYGIPDGIALKAPYKEERPN
ncbi:hypothetical protein ACOSQ2_003585 [Xanthoceras sorbifolium]